MLKFNWQKIKWSLSMAELIYIAEGILVIGNYIQSIQALCQLFKDIKSTGSTANSTPFFMKMNKLMFILQKFEEININFE